jgi:peroxiredoxin
MYMVDEESQRSRGKYVQEKVERPGLKSGDTLPVIVFEALKDQDGNPAEMSKIEKGYDGEVLIVYADPRRMTDETKLVLEELTKIPLKDLKVSIAAVNCDDCNDIRKYLKKNKRVTFSLLSDSDKRFMDALKCRSKNFLSSALLLLDPSSGKILRIWYENDFDAFTTKDLLNDEIKNYRLNPEQFLRRQIGIQ